MIWHGTQGGGGITGHVRELTLPICMDPFWSLGVMLEKYLLALT